MPTGLEVYAPDGTIIFTTTTRLGSVLGQVNAGTTNGSYDDARLANGLPFYYLVSNGPYANYTLKVEFTNGGTRIVWTWLSRGSGVNTTIIYGTY